MVHTHSSESGGGTEGAVGKNSCDATTSEGNAQLGGRRTRHVSIIGAVAWFIAAMTVHFAGPFGVFRGYRALGTFSVTIPACWFAVIFFKRSAALDERTALPGMTLAVVIATWLDAIAMTWFRPLYAVDASTALSGAAWILWGVGWLLLFSFRMSISCPTRVGKLPDNFRA